ncbi:MAG TPA: flagellar hook-basal body complex protein FliE [Hyphomicrobiales bacterium]|nr:flagellar hook-basal body complex protein FliE [Hyphomicrobiales bacterium]
MNTIDNAMGIEQVLRQIRLNAHLLQQGAAPAATASGSEFSSVLARSIDAVNGLQQEAGTLKTRYELGDAEVDLPGVMIASQKASLSFEAATQVRNKLLSAYQEIMSMQV